MAEALRFEHIWFDFSETIGFTDQARHDQLRYESYAQALGRPVSEQLKAEYETLYRAHAHSNSAVFRSLGLPAGYWSEQINSIDPGELFYLVDSSVPEVLTQIRKHVPISLFSNIDLGRILPALRIEASWFAHILSAGMVKEPKPALEGFRRMIDLTQLPPAKILYIGDDVEKDIRPAKQVGLLAGLLGKNDPTADYNFKHLRDILALWEA